MKRWMFFALFSFFWFFGGIALTVAGDSSPEISRFEVQLKPQEASIILKFNGVKGGIGAVDFSIGYEVERDSVLIKIGYATGLKIMSGPTVKVDSPQGLTAESGELRAVLPIKEEGIRPGDRVRYYLFLKDSSKRKSNVVYFELIVPNYAEL